MKAVVYRMGRGLVYEEVPDYRIASNEVLIRVVNVGFCGSDHSLIVNGLLPDGYILGHEISGTVARAGDGVQGIELGTRVCIRPTFCNTCESCRQGKNELCRVDRRTTGIGDLPGGFAEYVKAYPQMLIPIPEGVDSRSAALAETFATALHAVNCTRGRVGSVLVMGGGAVGLCLVRVLKILGYEPLVLLEPVEEKRGIAFLYGADYAFHPAAAGLNEWLKSHFPFGFEKVFECAGVGENINRAIGLVADGGEICIVSVMFSPLEIKTPFLFNLKEIQLVAAISNTHEENKRCLRWMAEGVIDASPLISEVITLEELPAVFREKIEKGLAVKVLVQVGEEF